MNRQSCRVRAARPADVPALLGLMRELAGFERYLDSFAVTEAELRRRGFPAAGEPEFNAFVAESGDGAVAGYAVSYLIPFTHDLKPTLVLKELFVRPADRSAGLGAALLQQVSAEARRRGCGRIRWAVLPDNDRAKAFYRRWGGTPDAQWEYWQRGLPATPAGA
jgi:ribosomal protein S18 acetylase RimI-like enzyme